VRKARRRLHAPVLKRLNDVLQQIVSKILVYREAGKSPHISCGKFVALDQKLQNLLSLRQLTQVPKHRHGLLEKNNFEPKKRASDLSKSYSV
jgi:hypothetical protein